MFLSFFTNNLYSQANLLNARVPQDVGELNEAQKKANNAEHLKYGYVDDRDVIWSKTVWELIDLDERINYPLYYPTEKNILGEERKSLFDVLVENIYNENIKEIYYTPYFNDKMSLENVEERMNYVFIPDEAKTISNQVGDGPLPQEYYDLIEEYRMTAKYVQEYHIKGTWYFDKRLGELKYRLLGIAPATIDRADIPDFTMDPTCCKEGIAPLFWVWFPDAREWLNKEKVFNSKNSSQPITYDHILNSRRFNSMIYREENLYEDRSIKDYISEDALRMLLESERIKSVIRDFEQDMWNN